MVVDNPFREASVRAYSVDFVLDRSQSVSFLFKCDGDGIKSLASLRLVSLVKEQLE